MAAQSERFGFKATVKYRFKPVILFRQGDLKFMPNDGLDCHAARFADVYERSVCRDIMGLVRDAALPAHASLGRGGGGTPSRTYPMDLNVPAIERIGGALIYIVDRYSDGDIYQFDFFPSASNGKRSGITYTLAFSIVCI